MQNITNADYIIVIFHTTCWAEGEWAILSQTVCTAPLGLKLITYTLNIWLKGIVWGSLTEVFFLHKQIYTFFYYIKQFHVYVQNIQNNIFSSPETDVNKYSFFLHLTMHDGYFCILIIFLIVWIQYIGIQYIILFLKHCPSLWFHLFKHMG